MGNFKKLGNGPNEYMMTRKLAFETAPPPSEHIVECLKVLRRISSVAVTDTVKTNSGKYCVVNVHSKDSPDEREPWFQIQRTVKEARVMAESLNGWSVQHLDLASYNIPDCAYCARFQDEARLWPSRLGGLFSSTAKNQEGLEQCLSHCITSAASEREGELRCFGVEHIPSVLVKFLLKGVDQSKL